MRQGLGRPLDYEDYAALPDDGKRYEVINGELYVTAAPAPLHQRVSFRLQRQLADYFHDRGLGEVFDAPLDVILTPHDFVQPDLVVVAEPDRISRRGIEGAPLLVVEILSPSTRRRDRGIKARRFAELGIPHYWIVDPDKHRLEFLRLEGASYRAVAQGEGDGLLAHPELKGLIVDLTELWRKPTGSRPA